MVLPLLVLENCLPASLRVTFRSGTASKTQKEGARSWRERTLKLFPAIEESQGFILKSAMTHNIYHEYFDGEGEVCLKVVGTDDKFEVQREKIEDGREAILRAAVFDEEEFRKSIQLKFLDGHCRIEAEYIMVNQTDKDLTFEVSFKSLQLNPFCDAKGGFEQQLPCTSWIISLYHPKKTELSGENPAACRRRLPQRDCHPRLDHEPPARDDGELEQTLQSSLYTCSCSDRGE